MHVVLTRSSPLHTPIACCVMTDIRRFQNLQRREISSECTIYAGVSSYSFKRKTAAPLAGRVEKIDPSTALASILPFLTFGL